MNHRKLIYISAALWCGGALYHGSPIIVIVAIFGHVTALWLHNIEVKINKLLDDRGIVVTDRDLAD